MRWLMLIGSLALCSAALASSGGRIISAQGVRVVVPAEWQRAQAAGAGAVTDPQTLLVVATKGVRPRASQCQIAAYSVPPAGAVVVVVGWKSLALSGAQHDKPGRGPLSKLRAVHRPSFECFSGRGAAASLVLRGKAYQVNVMVGNRASKERVAEALIVGRSFNLSPATPALWATAFGSPCRLAGRGTFARPNRRRPSPYCRPGTSSCQRATTTRAPMPIRA